VLEAGALHSKVHSFSHNLVLRFSCTNIILYKTFLFLMATDMSKKT
jgi:hypothetical protein